MKVTANTLRKGLQKNMNFKMFNEYEEGSNPSPLPRL
jgi:hypothetical protein